MTIGDPIPYNLVSFGPRRKAHIEWAKVPGATLCGVPFPFQPNFSRTPLHVGDKTLNLCRRCAAELSKMLTLDAAQARKDHHGFLV